MVRVQNCARRRPRLIGVVARRSQKLYWCGTLNAPQQRIDWLTPELLEHLRRVEYDFHVRAFGEEMARVNFLPLAERKAYIADMVDHARRKGVKFDKPAPGVMP